jgi:hypothetical protein
MGREVTCRIIWAERNIRESWLRAKDEIKNKVNYPTFADYGKLGHLSVWGTCDIRRASEALKGLLAGMVGAEDTQFDGAGG